MSRFWSIVFLMIPVLGTLNLVWAIFGWWPLADHWLPENVSEEGVTIDHLFNLILWLTGVIFLATCGALAWVLFRYGNDGDDNATATYSHGNTTLEIIWSVIPAAILVFLSIYQMDAWAATKIDRPTTTVDGQEVPVEPIALVMGKQFGWEIYYAGEDGKLGTADDFLIENELHVPAGESVVLQIESRDVLHSFAVPNLRLKQDVVPGMRQFVWFKATKTGDYEIMCTELCGWGHYKMKAICKIHSREDFDAWLKAASEDRLATEYIPE